MSKKPDPKLLAPLVDASLDLIPLHHPDHVDDKGRKRGKSPIDGNWTKRLYKNPDQIAHMKKGNNVGVRLAADFLVLDVDPKNMPEGRDVLTEFLANGDASAVHAAPTVRSGSGGFHYYMRKPADLPIRDSLPEYPGLEFKTVGRQMVAPGSVHPDTGEHYVWVDDELFGAPTGADLTDRPEAPGWLLDLIARPKSRQVDGLIGGRYTQDQVAEMLSALNPEDYRNHDDWLHIMMACHHASAGDAREEFIEWATGDPEYADHDKIIGQRWDSLHAEEHGRELVSYRSLLRLVKEAGRLDLLAPNDAEAEEDFAEADGPEADRQDPTGVKAASGGEALDEPPPAVTESVMAELGNRFVATLNAGKFEVLMRDYDPAFGRRYWQPMSKQAFKDYFEDERVRVDGRTISKADVFLRNQSSRKRKYNGIVFDPRPREMQRHKGKLNLWEGWAVKPEPGDWSLLRELIEDVLCAGKPEVAEYVLNWIARMFQRPWEVAESVLVFRGDEGVGKGTLARVLMRIAGAHGLTVASSQQVTGRFNSHLRNCIFLFSDEVNWRGNKTAEGMLKALLTEPVISYEQKGKDIVNAPNIIHMMMATNEKWVVPAGETARRFMVTDVLDDKKGDTAFWAALWEQMEAGGFQGFLHDMLTRDLSDWRPGMIPKTQGLAEQKLLSLQPVASFWLHLLTEGDLLHLSAHAPGNVNEWDKVVSWEEKSVLLGAKQREAIVIEFSHFLERGKHVGEVATHKVLVASAKKFGLVTTRDTRGNRVWALPKLSDMRVAFEEWLGFEAGSIFGEAEEDS